MTGGTGYRRLIAAAVLISAATACSGGDDESAATTTSSTVAETTTTSSTSTTTTTTTTTIPLVTEGATVVVANANTVGGSAGRMTDQLARAGFTTGGATNGIEKIADSIVYYTADAGAQAVAESLAAALGGVTAEPMPTPVPTDSGEVDGQVLLLLGNNQADKTFAELQNPGAAADGEADGEAPAAIGPLTTNGSTVIVANAAGVAGSAGRMSDALAASGFEVGDPTNAVVSLTGSVVHYTDAEGAQEDAELLAAVLGGVEVEPMPDEIPTESSELAGQVLLLLGSAEVDQTLVDPDS